MTAFRCIRRGIATNKRDFHSIRFPKATAQPVIGLRFETSLDRIHPTILPSKHRKNEKTKEKSGNKSTPNRLFMCCNNTKGSLNAEDVNYPFIYFCLELRLLWLLDSTEQRTKRVSLSLIIAAMVMHLASDMWFCRHLRRLFAPKARPVLAFI